MIDAPAFTAITYETCNRIAEISLNRPEVLNAINGTMLTELDRALDLAEADPEVNVILLSGHGRAFSAGFDLKESAARGEVTLAQWRQFLQVDFDLIMRFWDCPKPTVASVHGHCLGGGFELAMACDLTVASDTAMLGEPEVKFGSGVVALLLPWLTGPKMAKEIVLTGLDKLTSQRAYEIGLLNRVVPHAELEEAALSLASAISSAAGASVRMSKQAINRSYEVMGMRAALRQALELDIYIEANGGPEREAFNRIRREEGLKAAIAWREKRSARTV
ncbi:MAG: enoyl-CoA hydratase [Roseovarius sp. BRH_c41]|uniref:enoyl-CoA hydratase/isomerase family protein n=1 Tax=Roseovarius sp. BRH_c41 TaxID=1629709 RepID=UPI00061FD43D|nr:enoyl-CoA hydratase/isomerase family protein [Roseovarius sp. BRH_c41]KJS42977.1 MAG: enoyl-CoA hydratase [Roseovarius sp. BRH_c41]